MPSTAKLKEITLDILAKHFTSHILLYHACFPRVPADLGNRLHNVTPDEMYEQLSWYKKNFTIVPLSEWFRSKSKRGLAAVTFDDAYKCLYDHGLKVLEALEIPATIFVIGTTLENKIFWRDKVRFIESRNLAGEFIDYLTGKGEMYKSMAGRDFYTFSKDSDFLQQVPHKMLEQEIDDFLKEKNLIKKLNNYCVTSPEELIRHRLLTYGNHTRHHYLLSSLNDGEQFEEISKTHSLIRDIAGTDVVNILSVPFGGTGSFNDKTLSICKELEIECILTSSGSINGVSALPVYEGVSVAERFMVPDSKVALQKSIRKMTYQKFGKFRFNKQNPIDF